MTEVNIEDYPPYKMTDAEIAATVGRYQESVEPEPAPVIDVEDTHEVAIGRTPAAPPGVVYTGDVYSKKKGKSMKAHDAAVAAYPPGVRSSVPDAVDPKRKGIKEAEEALAAKSVTETHLEQVAKESAAKAADESEAADEAQERADQAADDGVAVPELDEAADRKSADAAVANDIAEAAELAADADLETGKDVTNAEPAKVTPDYSELTVADLRSSLGQRGLDYEYSARKADLVALLEADDAK